MLYISPKKRQKLSVFRESLYEHLKANAQRYSDQRERVLKTLYTQSFPVSIDKLVRLLNEEHHKAASYPTAVRHINFFKELGWLKVVQKRQKEYLLVETPPQWRDRFDAQGDYDPL